MAPKGTSKAGSPKRKRAASPRKKCPGDKKCRSPCKPKKCSPKKCPEGKQCRSPCKKAPTTLQCGAGTQKRSVRVTKKGAVSCPAKQNEKREAPAFFALQQKLVKKMQKTYAEENNGKKLSFKDALVQLKNDMEKSGYVKGSKEDNETWTFHLAQALGVPVPEAKPKKAASPKQPKKK